MFLSFNSITLLRNIGIKAINVIVTLQKTPIQGCA